MDNREKILYDNGRQDEKAGEFLEWFKELKCGSDFMSELY